MEVSKYKMIPVIFFGCFFMQLSAQSSKNLTVGELFQMGIDNSLKIKASQTNAAIATEAEAAAKIAKLPNIDVSATGGYLGNPIIFTGNGLTDPVNSPMPHGLQSYGISISQPLYRGGKIKYNIEKAALQKDIANLNLSKDKADIKLLLISKYLDLFRVYKEKELLEENIKQANQRLHDIKGMMKEGMITSNDVIRSELELTNYELSLRVVEDNIEIISQQLDIALGLDENLLLVPDTVELNAIHPLQSYEEYVSQAYDQYPELKIAHTGTVVAEKNLKIAQADYLPNLSLKAGNSLDRPILKSTPVVDDFANSWNISVVLSYSLSSLYQNKHNVGINKNMLIVNQTQEDIQKQNIRMNVKAAFIKHQQAIDRISVLNNSVKQANENYRIVQNKYYNQLSILTDLLDATSVRLRAELELTDAKVDVIYTYYQLLRSSGNL